MQYMLYRLYRAGSGGRAAGAGKAGAAPDIVAGCCNGGTFQAVILHIMHLLHDLKKESAYPCFAA